MTAADVDAVTRLIDQLHDDRPGVVDPARVRQGWRAFVARGDDERPVGFLLGSFFDYGLAHESSGSLDQLVVDESVRGLGVGEALVEQWLRDEGISLAFVSAGTGAEAFYERCGFTRGGGSWLAWVATAPGP